MTLIGRAAEWPYHHTVLTPQLRRGSCAFTIPTEARAVHREYSDIASFYTRPTTRQSNPHPRPPTLRAQGVPVAPSPDIPVIFVPRILSQATGDTASITEEEAIIGMRDALPVKVVSNVCVSGHEAVRTGVFMIRNAPHVASAGSGIGLAYLLVLGLRLEFVRLSPVASQVL